VQRGIAERELDTCLQYPKDPRQGHSTALRQPAHRQIGGSQQNPPGDLAVKKELGHQCV